MCRSRVGWPLSVPVLTCSKTDGRLVPGTFPEEHTSLYPLLSLGLFVVAWLRRPRDELIWLAVQLAPPTLGEWLRGLA